MSINWDFVTAQAKQKAKEYCLHKSFKNEEEYASVLNGYFQGYMENAGERESLRVVIEKLQKAEVVEAKDTGMKLHGQPVMEIPEGAIQLTPSLGSKYL